MKLKTCATLIYLNKEAEQFFVADHHYDCGYIRAYVKQKQLNITQYINSNLRTISEIVDDLLAMGNKTVIFCVDDANYYLNSVIAKDLKLKDDRVFIVWFGKSFNKYRSLIRENNSVDLLLTSHYEKEIYRLLTMNSEDLIFIEEHDYSYVSPYITEIIPVNEVGNTGTRLYRDILYIAKNTNNYLKAVIEEFNYFQSHYVKERIHFRDEDLLVSTNLFCELLKLIIENDYSFNLSGKVNFDNLTDSLLEEMLAAKFDYIEIYINQHSYSNALRFIDELLSISYRKEVKIHVSVELSNDHSIDNRNDFFRLYEILKEQASDKLSVKIETENLEEDQDKVFFQNRYQQYLREDLLSIAYKPSTRDTQIALINEYLPYLTGYYHYRLEVGDVKHIEIPKDVISSDTYRKLNDYLGINTSIINRKKEGKPSNVSEKKFNNNLLSARESQTYFSHYYQIYPKEEIINQILLDDYPMQPEDQFLEISYSKMEDCRLINEANLLKIETTKDLECFLEDVKYFEETGQFNHLYEVSSFLTEGCRWGVPRQCSLTKLHRFRINEDEDIFPCGGCNKIIGNLDDSMIDMIDTTFTITQEEERKRGCTTCKVSDVCSKCSFLPEFMTVDQYCSCRKSYENISRYMDISNLIYSLSRIYDRFSRSNLRTLKVSSNSISHTLTNSIERRGTNLIKPYIYLLYVEGKPIIVDGFNLKISEITVPLALIFEGLLKRVVNKNLINQITKSFHVDEEKAVHFLKKALNIFSESGYLNENEQKGVSV